MKTFLRQALTGSRRSDLVVALVVLLVSSMLLVPLPTMLLDALIVANLAFALVLLLTVLFMPNTLALLAFPSILLLSTLFRLSLNVACTRLILSDGYAGEVVEAFGTFLVGGAIVVGLTIFSIITIVNFLVIARGAARISEVAARFMLDSLPGKQNTIDADLRAGNITAREAETRREDLRKESQLYGAMDGAMKFVQGDAIAGLIIIVVNLIGGFFIGISNSMTISDAAATYATLTVGEGLVNQIPAILVSLCAGLVVTRIATGDQSSLGSELQAQLFSRPTTLLLSGILICIVGLLPGLPFLYFLFVGLGLGVASFLVSLNPVNQSSNLATLISTTSEPRQHLALSGVLGLPASSARQTESQVSLEIGVNPRNSLLNKQESGEFRLKWISLQQQFGARFGFPLPAASVIARPEIPQHQVVIRLQDEVLDEFSILPEGYLVCMSPNSAEIFGCEIVFESDHPLNGSRVFWTHLDSQSRSILELGRITICEALDFIALRLAAVLKNRPEQAIHLSDVLVGWKDLERNVPGLMSEAFNKEFINVARFCDVLHALVKEGVPLGSLRDLIEILAHYCAGPGKQLVREGEFDLQDIVSFIRYNRRRGMLANKINGRGGLRVLFLEPETEQLLRNSPEGIFGDRHIFGDRTFERLRLGLAQALEQLRTRGVMPVSVICHGELRSKVSSLLRSCLAHSGVVTFEELEPQIEIEPVAVWKVSAI